MTASRLAAVLCALPLLAACSVTVPVDVSRDVTVEAAAAGAFARAEAVDLAATGGSLWDKRDKVDAVSVDEVTATVLSVATGSGAALSVTLAFRPDGAPADGSQDVPVGTFSCLTVAEGATASLPGTPALDDLLLSIVKGSGKFTAVAGGSVSAPLSAVVRVRVQGSATGKVGSL